MSTDMQTNTDTLEVKQWKTRRKGGISIFDPKIIRAAIPESFKKLDPRVQVKNPVMFVVEVGSVVTTIEFVRLLFTKATPAFPQATLTAETIFVLAVSIWLWFTVVFANFAEAMAEGRGKAQADTLRRARTTTMAKRLASRDRSGKVKEVAAPELRKGDLVLIEAGDVIPGDGDVVEGVASVDESAITGELAHTNVPGSKHAKRYQDVEEILDAGIDVITTLNIQHLESLNDLVASITGVRVRETLPDWILDQADEVELIDISPYALRQRMKHGNIYPPERVETALDNFFREGNLTALRELALRRTAEKTETQLQEFMTEHGINKLWLASERVLVGFDARPHTRQVIRDAWRLAHGLHADLIAVWIEPEGYQAFTSKLIGWLKYGRDAKRYQEAALRRLEAHALLAEDLGAEVIRTKSRDIAKTLVQIARERQVTQLVLGQPARSRWEEIIHGSIINRVLRLSTDIDIHLVPRSGEEEA